MCFYVQIEHKSLTLGEVLDGDRMALSQYELEFKGEVSRQVVYTYIFCTDSQCYRYSIQVTWSFICMCLSRLLLFHHVSVLTVLKQVTQRFYSLWDQDMWVIGSTRKGFWPKLLLLMWPRESMPCYEPSDGIVMYTVFHKIGNPLFFCCNFSKYGQILTKIVS